MRKISNFCKRNLKELLRDPLIYVFCLGFPIVMFLLFYIINKFSGGHTPTFEVRALLGKDRPTVRIATAALATFFAATVGLSNTIAFAAGIYTDLTYLFPDLLCLALAVYFGARLFPLALPTQRKEDAQA